MTDQQNTTFRDYLVWGAGIAAMIGGVRAATRAFPSIRRGLHEIAAGASDYARAGLVGTQHRVNRVLTAAGHAGRDLMQDPRIIKGGLLGQLENVTELIALSDDAVTSARKAINKSRYASTAVHDLSYKAGEYTYRPMTVDDILNNVKRTNADIHEIGSFRIKNADLLNLDAARSRGIVGGDTLIDPNLMVRADATGKEVVRDISLLNPRAQAKRFIDKMRNMSFLGASPADVIPDWLLADRPLFGKLHPELPVARAGGGNIFMGTYDRLTAPQGFDYGLQVGRTVYGVRGYDVENLGEAAGDLVRSSRLVREHAANVGLGEMVINAKGANPVMTFAERRAANPELYAGVTGKIREFFERGFGFGRDQWWGLGVGECQAIGPQYARFTSLAGEVSDAWKRLTGEYVPVNLATGKRGADAIKQAPFIERLLAYARVSPPGETQLHWVSPERAKAPLTTLREAARAAKPYASEVTMKANWRAGSEATVMASLTPLEAAQAYGRKLATTPLATMEFATGMGVRPGTLGQTTMRLIAKGIIPAWMAWEAIKYTDFALDETTGISPFKAVAYTAAGASTARQGLLNATGFSTVSNYLNEGTNGLFNSPLGVVLRTGATIAGGLALSRGLAGSQRNIAHAMTLGVAAVQFTMTPGKDMSRQWEESTGQVDVPIRKNRWWMLGADPFEGGMITSYRKSFTGQVINDELYDRYGGKADYWKHISLLPNPENLFGVRKIADPYSWEREHYYDMPYPVTRGMFSDVPLVGSALNLTVGNVLKPRRMMHTEELQQWLNQAGRYSGEPGFQGAAQQLGYPSVRPMVQAPHYGIGDQVGEVIQSAEDYFGMSGFMFSFAKEQLTGSQLWFQSGPRWQTPDYDVSQRRGLADMELGGGFGLTEFPRRLWVKRPHERYEINPIPNQMPSWLPGERSEFGDTEWMNLHTGNVGAKMTYGATRLKMQTDDPFERWSTLQNVAPYSNAAKYYGQLIDHMAETGQLGSDRIKKYKDIKTRDPIYTYSTSFGPQGNSFSIPWVSTKLMGARSGLEQYRSRVLYGSDFHDWRRPYEAMMEPYLAYYGSRSPWEAAVGGAALGIGGRTPVAALGLAATGAAVTTGKSLYSEVFGASVSGQEAQREQQEEYFDKVKYMKYRRLEQQAMEKGNRALAWRFRQASKGTMAGLDYSANTRDFYRQAYRAVPKKDKPYLMALAGDPNADVNELPPYLRPIVAKLRGGTSQRSQDQQAIDQQVAGWLMGSGGMPGSNWIGWNPDVDIDDVKMVEVANEGGNFHDYGGYQQQYSSIMANMPYIQPVHTYQPDLLGAMSARDQVAGMMGGFSDVSVSAFPIPGRSQVRFDINRDRQEDVRSYRHYSSGRLFA